MDYTTKYPAVPANDGAQQFFQHLNHTNLLNFSDRTPMGGCSHFGTGKSYEKVTSREDISSQKLDLSRTIASPEMELLGRTSLHADMRDSDTIDVEGHCPSPQNRGVQAVQIRTTSEPVEIDQIVIEFGNGEKFPVDVREHFQPGSQSRVFDLPGDLRCVERIYVRGQTEARQDYRPARLAARCLQDPCPCRCPGTAEDSHVKAWLKSGEFAWISRPPDTITALDTITVIFLDTAQSPVQAMTDRISVTAYERAMAAPSAVTMSWSAAPIPTTPAAWLI